MLSRGLQHKHRPALLELVSFSTISVSLVDRDFQTNNQPATILQTTALARGIDAVAYSMVCSHMGCGLTVTG